MKCDRRNYVNLKLSVNTYVHILSPFVLFVTKTPTLRTTKSFQNLSAGTGVSYISNGSPGDGNELNI